MWQRSKLLALFHHLVGPRFTDVFAFLAFQKTGGAFASVSGFCHNSWRSIVTAIVGTGLMTTADYIAIGVLIVLGVFAIAAVSGGKFKL
jgi:hypothetical protein